MSDRSVILFGGKGGVGKTTCSAATAVQLASRGQKTLIITSDMTPSLSDVLEEPIGDCVRSLDANLFAVEVGADAVVNRWKKRFGRDFQDILSNLVDVEALDAESRHQLLDYIGSAPSLREETMLDLIVDLVETGGYERVVWDTAPAGETLNLLSMPTFIRKHLTAGAKVFQGLDMIGKQLMGRRSIAEIMDEWIAVSERLSRFLLERASFIVVANPEALVVSQARRLFQTLKDYRVHLHGMVINRIVEQADSPFLQAMKSTQDKYLQELMRMAEGMRVARLPLSLTEIKGRKALKEIGETMVRELGL
jgi:arsenite-transporting ATPase